MVPIPKVFLHIRDENTLAMEDPPNFANRSSKEVRIHGLVAPKRGREAYENALATLCVMLSQGEFIFVEYIEEGGAEMDVCRVYYKDCGRLIDVADFVKRELKRSRKRVNLDEEIPF